MGSRLDETSRCTAKMKKIFLLFLVLAVSARADITSDMAFEQSAWMAQNYYVSSVILQGQYAPDGAASPINIAYGQSGFSAGNTQWRIQEQSYGRDFVLYGIVHNDKPVSVSGVGTVNPVEFGLLVLQWGLNQQLLNGGYACQDTFHSTSFFVEAVADACLALNASQYALQYADWTTAAALKIHLSAEWMMENQAAYAEVEQQYGHRYWLAAAAFQLTGVLTHDTTLENNAIGYINRGYAAQLPDGVNPELGGPDSSYQGVGLVFACRLCDFLADKTYAGKVKTMISRGEAWEETRVLSDGVVSSQGNTRTGSCQEKGPNGNCEDIDYPYVFASFYHWSFISAQPSYAVEATLVADGYRLVLSSQEPL